MDGAVDARETASINGGSFGATVGPAYDINIAFTDTGSNSHVETFYFLIPVELGTSFSSQDQSLPSGRPWAASRSITITPTPYTTITCFVRGALIETMNRMVPVEKLRAGAKVLTSDGNFKALRISMNRKLSAHAISKNPKLAPVRIMAGALGNGLPARDLLVSHQHRMLVSSKICERMFGQHNVLLAAIRLTELPGIFVVPPLNDLEYFHLVFDHHEVIFAESALTESFYPNPEALESIPSERHAKKFWLSFPKSAILIRHLYRPTQLFPAQS